MTDPNMLCFEAENMPRSGPVRPKKCQLGLGTVGCAVPGETADGLEGDHEQDRDRGAEIATAPVACPHCGGVLRLVREIPRRKEPLSARGPPQAPPPCGAAP